MNEKMNICAWPEKSKWSRQQVVQGLKKALSERVHEAYLFGSFAQNRATKNSDVDLILVSDSKRPWVERFRDFGDLWKLFGAVDLLVYTPDEWKKIQKGGSSLINHARKSWIRVI